MSKKISSIVTSIAGVMVAIPTTSDANIATTGYVNKIVNQTHAVGSALQFGLLADDASPLFMLGATNQPTAGANGGSLVGQYGAISVERLGKHLAGFEGGNGSFVLVGDGTTTGTAGWMGITDLALNIPGAYIAGYGSFYMDKTDDSASAKVILGQNTDDAAQLKNQSPEWFRVDKLGKHLAGFDIRTDQALTGITHMLAGNGTTSGKAQWIKIDKFAAYMPGSQIAGYGTGQGNFLLIGGGTENDSAGWGKIQDVLAGLRATGIDDQTTGAASILVRDNNFSNEAHWAGSNWLAEQLHGSMINNYGNGQEENTNGSLYLLGGDGTKSGAARWVGLNDFAYNIPGDYLAGFSTGSVNGTADYQQPMYIMGQGNVDATQLSMQSPAWYSVSQLARNLSGFSTGSGSHILVGDGTTSGTAAWATIKDTIRDMFQNDANVSERYDTYMLEYTRGKNVVTAKPRNALYSEIVRSRRMTAAEISGFPAIAKSGNDGWIAIPQAAEALGSLIGSYASGFATGSGSYVLVGDGTTSGTAAWSSVEDIVFNAPYSTVTRDFHNVLVNQEGNGTHTNLKMPKTYFGSLISPHIQGSAISGYTTGSGAPTYILGTNTTGAVTGATMQLHAISGLGSEIKFTETKTAAELKASTGTVYFPVIQNGQIYGVTLNDFYILMNAKF